MPLQVSVQGIDLHAQIHTHDVIAYAATRAASPHCRCGHAAKPASALPRIKLHDSDAFGVDQGIAGDSRAGDAAAAGAVHVCGFKPSAGGCPAVHAALGAESATGPVAAAHLGAVHCSV